jgi:MFS superfamily sulfate permease-like transporter
VRFAGALGFHNFLGIRGKLEALPKGKRVALDFSGVHYIDHTVMDRLTTFKREYAQDGGEVEFTGMGHLAGDTHDPLTPRRGVPAASAA